MCSILNMYSFFTNVFCSYKCILFRVAGSDSNLYSLLKISVSEVANMVGSLLFVSKYQISNLYSSLTTIDNFYFFDPDILKTCNSYDLHDSLDENLDVYSPQENLKPVVYVQT